MLFLSSRYSFFRKYLLPGAFLLFQKAQRDFLLTCRKKDRDTEDNKMCTYSSRSNRTQTVAKILLPYHSLLKQARVLRYFFIVPYLKPIKIRVFRKSGQILAADPDHGSGKPAFRARFVR